MGSPLPDTELNKWEIQFHGYSSHSVKDQDVPHGKVRDHEQDH